MPEWALRELERGRFDVVVWRVTAEDLDSRRRRLWQIRARTRSPLSVVDRDPQAAQVDLEAGTDQWLLDVYPAEALGAIRAAVRKSSPFAGTISDRIELLGVGAARPGETGPATPGRTHPLLTRQE